MTRFSLALLPAASLLVLAACSDNTPPEPDMTAEEDVAIETTTISGSLAYRERIALQPGSVASVVLIDGSARSDVDDVIAEETIALGDRQPPIPFELTVDGAELDASRTYAVHGEIRDRTGTVQWATETPHMIDTTSAANDLGVLSLTRVAQPEPEPADDPQLDTITYTCGGQTLTIETMEDDSAHLTWGSATFEVERVESDTGIRYEVADGNVVFLDRGADASLEVAGQQVPVCTRD